MISNNSVSRTVKCLAVVAFLIGFCERATSETGTSLPNAQDIQDKIKERFPEGLPQLPVNVSVPTEQEATQLLKDKCDRIGGPEAYNRVTAAREEVQNCVMSLVNVTELQVEMEQAKPTGDLDVVFKKYCRKSPILKDCISNFTSTLELCMEDREKESKRIVQNITEALLNFLCFKEGDRIALFIAEGGPECIDQRKDEIQACANKTLSQYVPQDSATITQLPMFVLDKKECRSFLDLQKCVVNSLEKCQEPTPANIIESLFLFVTKLTPCEEERVALASEAGSTSSIVTASIGLLLLTFMPFVIRV